MTLYDLTGLLGVFLGVTMIAFSGRLARNLAPWNRRARIGSKPSLRSQQTAIAITGVGFALWGTGFALWGP